MTYAASIRIALTLLLCAAPPLAVAAQIAVAWNERSETRPGHVNTFVARDPWPLRRQALAAGSDSILNFFRGRLFVLSRGEGTLSYAVPGHRWRRSRTIDLGATSQPEDVAVVDQRTAYVTRRTSNWLSRVDLRDGSVTDVVDLSAFADEDGNADLGEMIVDGSRLFVQIRRYNEDGVFRQAPPAYLAVVDLATQSLLDVDPETPGNQAIRLEGTSPKGRMQILPESRQLFVSATGGSMDEGGLEAIDLETLKSQGLIIREADGKTGADLGPFVMVTPERGFLVFSTDLDLSSHLEGFSIEGGVEPGPEIHVTVGYAMPSIVYEPRQNAIYVPDGAFSRQGIYAYDARTHQPLTAEPIPIEGQPTDLLLLRR